MNPNFAWAWYHSGWVRAWRGEPEVAIQHLKQAMRRSPLDPLTYSFYGGIAFAHFLAGRYSEACSWAQKSVRAQPNFVVAIRVLAASQALAGLGEEARTTIARVRHHNPRERISSLKE